MKVKQLLSTLAIGILTISMVGCESKEPLMDSDVVSEISTDAVDRWDDGFDVNTCELNGDLVIQLIVDRYLDEQTPMYKIQYMKGFNNNLHTTKILTKKYLKDTKAKLEKEGYNNEIVLVMTDKDNNIMFSLDTEGNEVTSDGSEFKKLNDIYKDNNTN